MYVRVSNEFVKFRVETPSSCLENGANAPRAIVVSDCMLADCCRPLDNGESE